MVFFLPKKSWAREELLHLLSLSGTLAGLCITGVTLRHSLAGSSRMESLADEMLAFSALLFLLSCYLIFFALRHRESRHAQRLEMVADGLFFVALTGMVAAGFVMVCLIR